VGRRARLLLAALVGLGTAIPLVLSAPGGPGTSFLRVAAPVTDDTTTSTTTTTTPPATKQATTTSTTLAGKAAPPHGAVAPSTTSSTRRPSSPKTSSPSPPAPTAPPATSPSSSGLGLTWCTANQLGLSVATNQASYNPGDSMQINVAAVNRGTAACVLNDPDRTNPPDGTCQPETLVEAPWNASLPNIQQVVADVGPPCNGSTHYLVPGDAWHASMTVVIPSDGSWSPGSYSVHSEWQAPGELVSADTSFDLSGTTTTTQPPPTTTTVPPPDTTTTTAPA
jgi:hypothetical protein